MGSSKRRRPETPETVVYPVTLYKSIQGRYFIGYADQLRYGQETSAWAGLINPADSGVLLHVAVVTLTQVSGLSFRGEFWVNAVLPGCPESSPLVTPANTALTPLPQPKVLLLQASDVVGRPQGGFEIDWEQSILETTIVVEEGGNLIIPPGGSLVIFLAPQGTGEEPSMGRVAFGWWEDPIEPRD